MGGFSNLGDGDLVRLMAAGSEEAFVALYRRRQGAMYRFALQMSGSPSIAEEVTQEVFLALIRGTDNYDASRGPVASWLFGIARNRVLRCLERDGRYLSMEDDVLEEETEEKKGASREENPLEDLTRRETLESVRQAVLSLPPHYREAVVLCDLQEMSYEEAARVLNCAVGTVRSRLHRGRALLGVRLRAKVRCTS
jgi:RNA polymerase sigma-70 factor (ECF subfamily)